MLFSRLFGIRRLNTGYTTDNPHMAARALQDWMMNMFDIDLVSLEKSTMPPCPERARPVILREIVRLVELLVGVSPVRLQEELPAIQVRVLSNNFCEPCVPCLRLVNYRNSEQVTTGQLCSLKKESLRTLNIPVVKKWSRPRRLKMRPGRY